MAGPASAAQRPSTRDTAAVQVSHWLVVLCFVGLVISGAHIVSSHPRFYWGEDGNVLATPLFTIPIPASRGYVPTAYDFRLPDANWWARSLHFQAAWLLVLTGLFYVVWGIRRGHFRANLLPGRSWGAFKREVVNHLRPWAIRPSSEYNVLQRLAYFGVVFVLSPLMIWTGLAMSPALVSVFPPLVTSLGGHQSARTIHFLVSSLLVLFSVAHLLMVYWTGSRFRGGIDE